MKMSHINGNEKIGNAKLQINKKNDQIYLGGSGSERCHLLVLFCNKLLEDITLQKVAFISKINHDELKGVFNFFLADFSKHS